MFEVPDIAQAAETANVLPGLVIAILTFIGGVTVVESVASPVAKRYPNERSCGNRVRVFENMKKLEPEQEAELRWLKARHNRLRIQKDPALAKQLKGKYIPTVADFASARSGETVTRAMFDNVQKTNLIRRQIAQEVAEEMKR